MGKMEFKIFSNKNFWMKRNEEQKIEHEENNVT